MKTYSKAWVCTDADNHQYGTQIDYSVFLFKEFDRNNYHINIEDYGTEENYIDTIFGNEVFWVAKAIDLKDYSDKQIRNYISAYYKSLEELYEIYGEQSNWIIAECIFEQTSGLY